jgi:Ser/Thr protein kinase RdoA (MazF antagonist)
MDDEIEDIPARGWGLVNVNNVVRLKASPGSTALYRIEAEQRSYLLTEHQRQTCGALWTLRPWLTGEPLDRERLSHARVSTLGRTLGRCHRLLSGLPNGDAVPWTNQVSTAIDEIETLAAHIRSRSRAAEGDEKVLAVLTAKRRLLEDAPDLRAVFRLFPSQIIHGDYHVENVLVDLKGELAAVIDIGGGPGYRVREVCYAIWWSLPRWDTDAFEMPLAQAFIRGCNKEAGLTADELRAGPEMLRWWLLVATWDARRYAGDPGDADALDGVLWFFRLAEWLGVHGRRLGGELARIT